MKKRWIPLIIACMIAVFTFGLRFGAESETERQLDIQAAQRSLSTTIAVVNGDAGIMVNDEVYNYSAAIINTLGDDFVLVSPAMAQTGFMNGTYGAIVTFPASVSARVLSFNAVWPERVQLEFQINPNLSEREYLETFIAITELQMAINTTLASTYVSSILRQFHDAQDQVDGVFQNNLADLLAVEFITLSDFTANLELDEVPFIPLEPNELDTPFYMDHVSAFAEDVSHWYLQSYALASNQFLWMRDGLIRLTDNFPAQEDNWMNMLMAWTQYSEDYGELLDIYAEEVHAHEEALFAWHLDNVDWNESLETYQTQIFDLHELSNLWLEHAELWHKDYLSFLRAVTDYSVAITAHQGELDSSLTPVLDDLTLWQEKLVEYDVRLRVQFTNFQDMVETHNAHADISNDFLEYLLEWHTGLYTHHETLTDWMETVNDRQLDLNSRQHEISTALRKLYDDADDLPDVPDTIPDDDLPEPSLLPPVPGVTSGPAIAIPPVTATPGALEIIYGEVPDLDYYIGLITDWYGQLQQDANDMVQWQDTMAGYYDDILEFYALLQYLMRDLTDWRDGFGAFSEALFTVVQPKLPHFADLAYLETPDAVEQSVPDHPDPLETVPLPAWDDRIASPPQYTGRQIESAFSIELPLDDRAAMEVPHWDKPPDILDDQEPMTVDAYFMLTAERPDSPLMEHPPRPDDFWSALDLMHDQLLSFDVEEFLSDDVHQRVAHSLQSYESFLETIRGDLNDLFEDNIWLMHDVNTEYNTFLEGLRSASFAAAGSEQDALQEAIERFVTFRELNNDNTVSRLGTFASMMPESRAVAGINQRLVDFTVMPFDFVPADIRDDLVFDHPKSMVGVYLRYQKMAVWLVGGVFAVTLLGIYGAFVYRNRKL